MLRIKDVWHRLPSYPDEVSGWEIYTAVLRDDVRTSEQFARWLAAKWLPKPRCGRAVGNGSPELTAARQILTELSRWQDAFA